MAIKSPPKRGHCRELPKMADTVEKVGNFLSLKDQQKTDLL
jgi:hypothetical protein